MNAIAQRLSPSVTSMIRMDHSHVMLAFHRYRSELPPERKAALVRHICLALQIHAQLEEEIFYPALRAVLSGDEVLNKSEPEHDQMRALTGELQALVNQSSGFDERSLDEKFFELMRLVMHHVADEETTLLPAAEDLLGAQLGRLGAEMTKRRVQLLKSHAGEVMDSTVRAFPVGAAAATLVLTTTLVALGMGLLRGGKRRMYVRL